MPYSQFLRIESMAGGTSCTNTAFIRACHSVLSDEGRTRKHRTWRHSWIRSGLLLLEDSKALCRQFVM